MSEQETELKKVPAAPVEIRKHLCKSAAEMLEQALDEAREGVIEDVIMVTISPDEKVRSWIHTRRHLLALGSLPYLEERIKEDA